MSNLVVVAGATGNLGGRIAAALIKRGAIVRALVRLGTEVERLAPLEQMGIDVEKVDYDDANALRMACESAVCVVSALQGLRDVIIDVQSQLLNAAVSARVPRFIPSDFAADITKVPDDENRNFAWRREFREVLLKAPIRSSSILNGMFMDLLLRGVPIFDLRNKSVSYSGDPDQKLDFTTMDDTAAFTAAVALDTNAPQILRVAGDEVSANDLAKIGKQATGEDFQLIRYGSLDDLAHGIAAVRAAHPEQEDEEFPRFQQMQYMHNMQTGRAKLEPIDNGRYPDIEISTFAALLQRHLTLAGD